MRAVRVKEVRSRWSLGKTHMQMSVNLTREQLDGSIERHKRTLEQIEDVP